MKKKWIILIVIILLLVVSGGVFWWERNQGEEKEHLVQIKEAVEYPTAKEWVIKDTSEGKIVENEKAELTIKVPKGWKIEKKEIGSNEWSVSLSSLDSRLSENKLYPVAGCGVSVVVEYSKDNFEIEKAYLKGYQKNPDFYQKKGIDVVKVDGYSASRKIVWNSSKIGQSIEVRVPVNNKVYVFGTILAPKDKNRCSVEFDNFLKGVSIR